MSTSPDVTTHRAGAQPGTPTFTVLLGVIISLQLFGISVTSPPPWNEAAAPTRSGFAAAVRSAIGPPMQ